MYYLWITHTDTKSSMSYIKLVPNRLFQLDYLSWGKPVSWLWPLYLKQIWSNRRDRLESQKYTTKMHVDSMCGLLFTLVIYKYIDLDKASELCHSYCTCLQLISKTYVREFALTVPSYFLLNSFYFVFQRYIKILEKTVHNHNPATNNTNQQSTYNRTNELTKDKVPHKTWWLRLCASKW